MRTTTSPLALPEEAMRQKIRRLRLEVVDQALQQWTTTSIVMPKELPSVEEEKQLREMVQEHKRLNEIAGFFGKSPECIKMKISRLKLVVVVRQIHATTTSDELPSVENAWPLKN